MTENPYQSPALVPVKGKGRSRTGCGITLIVLGLLLSARVLWLGYWWWTTANEETRNCVFVLSQLGFIIALVGCWLAFRSRIALGVAIAWGIGPFIVAYLLDRLFGI